MRWLRDRRGYGELRLRVHRRRARREAWLDRRLRARRRQLLRTLRSSAPLIVGLWLLVAASTFVCPPLTRAFLLGAWTAIAALGGWLLLALADGSLLARLARRLEEQVGDE